MGPYPPLLLALTRAKNFLSPCLNFRVACYKDVLICHWDVLLFSFLATKKSLIFLKDNKLPTSKATFIMKFLGNGDYDDNDNDADTSWLAPLCMNTFLRWRSVNIRDWLQLSVVDTKWENIQLRWLGSYDGWWRIRCANIHNYFTCVTMYLVMTRNKMVPYMYAQYFTEPEHPPPPFPGNNRPFLNYL